MDEKVVLQLTRQRVKRASAAVVDDRTCRLRMELLANRPIRQMIIANPDL